MSDRLFNKATLERWMLIAKDTRKEFIHNKDKETWAWVDRSEMFNQDAYHTGFPTFLDALQSAVAPYA